MQPLAAVRRRDNALGAQHRAERRVAERGQRVFQLVLGVLMRGLHAPGGEHLVRVVVMVVAAAAVVMIVVMVMLVLMIVVMVMAAAGAVRAVVMVVMVFVLMLMIVVLVLMIVVVMMVVVLMVRLARNLVEHLLHQVAAALHGLEQLHAGQLLPRGGDDARMRVEPAQQADNLFQPVRRALCGARQQDRARVCHLIFKKLAEVLEVHLGLERIDDRDKRVERHVQMRVLHRRDDVGQLAHAGRLDQDAVRAVLVYYIVQRLAEVAHQRAADAARVHLVDDNAGILEEAAVNADLAELVLDQHDLFALEGVRQQALDQRSLARAEKARNNINFRHCFRLVQFSLQVFSNSIPLFSKKGKHFS